MCPSNMWPQINVRPLLVESPLIVNFFFDVLYSNYRLFWKKTNFFFQLRQQEVNNCFKLLILSVFTTVVSRLKSE